MRLTRCSTPCPCGGGTSTTTTPWRGGVPGHLRQRSGEPQGRGPQPDRPGPAGQREGLEGLRPSPDVRRLPLVHRLHPHPQLGEEGVPGSCGERGNGQTVGGHLPGSAHYRRRQVRRQVAPAYRDPGPSGGEAEPAELQVPPLHQLPGHGPDCGTAGGPHLGGG